jgi:hypothetical protein
VAKLVVLITSRVDEAQQIGAAWQEAGAPGVTFIESYGLNRLNAANRDIEVLPGTLSLLRVMRDNYDNGLVVLSLVEHDYVVDPMIAAAERILGDLREPDNGIAFVLDVERALGFRYHRG